jgi:hypothetical protein
VKRALVLALLLAGSVPLAAQERFVAPTFATISGYTEEGVGENPAHVLYVQNSSTVPVVVFGLLLTECENVRYGCGGRRVKIRVAPDRRVTVGHVEAQDHERGFRYRWTFSYYGDSSDAKAMAMLREHGIEFDPRGGLRVAQRTAPDTAVARALIEQAEATSPVDTAPRRVFLYRNGPPPRDERPPERTVRFKLGWGSILGWTMVPNHVIEPTGSCVDPAQTAKYEKNPKIEKMPWKPAKLDRSFGQIRLPEVLGDSVLKSDEVLVRFVADTNRTVIPESVSVLESPSGTISVQVCQAVMSGAFDPAKNKDDQVVQSWVQTTVHINRLQ